MAYEADDETFFYQSSNQINKEVQAVFFGAVVFYVVLKCFADKNTASEIISDATSK